MMMSGLLLLIRLKYKRLLGTQRHEVHGKSRYNAEVVGFIAQFLPAEHYSVGAAPIDTGLGIAKGSRCTERQH